MFRKTWCSSMLPKDAWCRCSKTGVLPSPATISTIQAAVSPHRHLSWWSTHFATKLDASARCVSYGIADGSKTSAEALLAPLARFNLAGNYHIHAIAFGLFTYVRSAVQRLLKLGRKERVREAGWGCAHG